MQEKLHPNKILTNFDGMKGISSRDWIEKSKAVICILSTKRENEFNEDRGKNAAQRS